MRLLATFQDFAGDEEVDGVGFFGTFDAFFEGEGEDARVVAEPPVVGFGAGETGAVDTGLLTCTETDDGAVEGVGDGVRLSVFEGKGGDNEVGDGGVRKLANIHVRTILKRPRQENKGVPPCSW